MTGYNTKTKKIKTKNKIKQKYTTKDTCQRTG